jgi:hypothetical protein
MSKILAIISVVGLVMCAALFGLARMIGGDAIFHDSNSFAGIKPLIDLATHKEWRWDGGDSLALDAPVNVHYHQGGAPRVTVTGDADLLRHVRVGSGRIVSDSPHVKTQAAAPRLDAVIGGMALRKFIVSGSETLDLGEINQDELEIHVDGPGSITGTGHVARLSLTIAGSGRADLGGLSVQDATVMIFGSGKGTIAPHGLLKLAVTGSGRLFLAARPSRIEQKILGSGGIANDGEMQNEMRVPVPMPIPMPMAMPPAPPEPPVVSKDGDGIRKYTVRDGADVNLGHLDQDSLSVTIPGSGKLRAEGRVGTLSVTILGSGMVDFGKLAAGDTKVHIAGDGDVIVAPSGNMHVSLLGSGIVHLRSRPRSIHRSVMGSGQVLEEY